MASLRFAFDAGSGACLWAHDDAARDALGVGPLDAEIRAVDGRVAVAARIALSPEARALRDALDRDYLASLNPIYPPDPSLWRQSRCDRFNADAERLLGMIRAELHGSHEIFDDQPRMAEDPRLADYLASNPSLRATD